LPLVSIITSTYKHERYLRRTIDSVLSQDYPRIEYLVINDGSPDGTEEILKSYADRFIWKSQQNMGEVPTLNNAFRMVNGELVGKLSSDDYLYPNAVKDAVNLFLSNPELIVVYSDFDLVDENDVVFQHIHKPDYNLVEAVKNHWCLPGTGTLFRKEIFEQLGGFDPEFRILFDMDFWWRAGLLGPFARSPEPSSAFRQHRASQSSMGGERMASETVRFVEKFYQIPNLPQEFKKVKQAAFSNAFYAAGMQSVQNKNIKNARSYLIKSIQYAPWDYLKKSNRTKLRNIIDVIVSPKVALTLNKLLYKI